MFKSLFRKEKNADAESRASELDGIDAETLEVAKMLVSEKRISKAANAKWKPGKKRTGAGSAATADSAAASETDIVEAINATLPNRNKIVNQIFERTVEDTILANRFQTPDGKEYRHLSVRKAKAMAMDGLRDIDEVANAGVGVSDSHATTMNPEGRFAMPTFSDAKHDFAQRFSEAMNPRGSAHWSVIPELMLNHYAQYSTFIGYPMCEVLGTHPTISNACTIPGQDAIAPGYKLKFVDSEDVDKDGVPDDIEVAELGGVKRSLERMSSMESLKDAIVAVSSDVKGERATESLNALALTLERLAAYEEWERSSQGNENAAQAIHEAVVNPVSEVLATFVKRSDEAARKNALTTLSLALSDLSKREHLSLDEVRGDMQRRGTVTAISVAFETVSKRGVEWDSVRALNDLAVAVERVAAYKNYSDRNAELLTALTGALTGLSTRITPDTQEAAMNALSRAIEAMDEDEFDFEDPAMDGVAKPTEKAQAVAAASANGNGNGNGAGGGGGGGGGNVVWSGNGGANAAAPETGIPDIPQGGVSANPPGGIGVPGVANPAGSPSASLAMPGAAAGAEGAAGADPREEQIEEQHKQSVETARIAQERQKLLDQWKKRADELGMNKVCERIVRNSRMFGIGIAVPIVEGVDYEKPFNIDCVKPESYRGFAVIEPTWIYPETEADDLVNPLSGSFFEPMYWAVTGASTIGSLAVRRIHRSWMVICRHKEVPNMLRPMYYYGGIPLTQELYEPVFIADKLMNEVPKLAMTKRTTVVKGDPNDIITNPEGVVDRLQAFSQVQDNFGILWVGRNADVTKLETSLSEFDQLIAKANQRIAAIATMPETKLFKTQLAGMNSAGRYEWDDYSQLLINIQNNIFLPLLNFHFMLDTKSHNGAVIQLTVSFNAIDVPTQSEKEESESRSIQTLNSALQSGWLAPNEARIIARSRENSMFSSIPAEMPEELMQQQQQQQQQGMGAPGGEGGEGGEGGGDNPLAALLGGGGGSMPKAPSASPKAGSPLDAPDAPKEQMPPKERK